MAAEAVLYLNINGFILLKLLYRQIIWGSAGKGKWITCNKNLLKSKTPRQDFRIPYLLVKRKSSKALANSDHIVSNFPDEACCRATGNPMDRTFSKDETASFQVLSDGQAYFRPKGVLKVLKVEKRKQPRNHNACQH